MPLEDSSNTLSVDCDGVIADKNHGGDYSKAGPLQYGIEQVNKLYDKGYNIILYTARYGERRKGNLHEMYEAGYREWTDWLEETGVKYHHAYMGKPAGVLYIDDKAARVNGNDQGGWTDVWKEVKSLEGKDKYGNFTDEQRAYWDSFVE